MRGRPDRGRAPAPRLLQLVRDEATGRPKVVPQLGRGTSQPRAKRPKGVAGY